jgi:MYND finger
MACLLRISWHIRRICHAVCHPAPLSPHNQLSRRVELFPRQLYAVLNCIMAHSCTQGRPVSPSAWEISVKGVETIVNEWSTIGLSREHAENFCKIQIYHGLVRYLANAIPCSCMNNVLKEAKPFPKIGICCVCGKRNTNVKLFKCSRCKIAEYCSKECQMADWKRHKTQCNRWKK